MGKTRSFYLWRNFLSCAFDYRCRDIFTEVIEINKLESLKGILEQEVNLLGYELYHLEYVKEMGQNYLRFYIDKEGGISLEDCEKVSRRMSAILDEKDPIPEEYFLEVSSPGIFRTLFTDRHLQDAIGEQVLVKTKKPVEGAKTNKGILENVTGDTLTLAMDKGTVDIPREIIRSVNIEEDL